MFEGISCSGQYVDQLLGVEVTLMDSLEFPFPINKYIVFDVTVKCKDNEQKLEVSDFRFYLMCEGVIYNQIDISSDTEVWKYVEGSGSYNMFCGIPRVGLCESQSLTVLFPRVDEIRYKLSSLVFYYEPYQHLISIKLKY